MELVVKRRLGVCLAVTIASASLGVGLAYAQALSTNDKRAYHAAFADAQKSNWKGAAREAAMARDPLPREALHWLAIIRGANGASFGESGAMLFADCGVVPDPSAQEIGRASCRERVSECV